jgi:hypothetical protein
LEASASRHSSSRSSSCPPAMGEPPFSAARYVDLAVGDKPCDSPRQHRGIEV